MLIRIESVCYFSRNSLNFNTAPSFNVGMKLNPKAVIIACPSRPTRSSFVIWQGLALQWAALSSIHSGSRGFLHHLKTIGRDKLHFDSNIRHYPPYFGSNRILNFCFLFYNTHGYILKDLTLSLFFILNFIGFQTYGFCVLFPCLSYFGYARALWGKNGLSRSFFSGI